MQPHSMRSSATWLLAAALLAPDRPAVAQGSPEIAAPPIVVAAASSHRGRIARYLRARRAYEEQADAYWQSISEKRRARFAKRRGGQPVGLDDYVLTQPPVTLAAAVLLGGVTNAMLLGHWHLNQPRLGTAPIRRVVYGLWAGIVAYAAAAAYLATTGARGPALATLAVLAIIAVLTAMVTQLVRTRSIMSATGVLYLEVLLCFVAVFTGSLSALA